MGPSLAWVFPVTGSGMPLETMTFDPAKNLLTLLAAVTNFRPLSSRVTEGLAL